MGWHVRGEAVEVRESEYRSVTYLANQSSIANVNLQFLISMAKMANGLHMMVNMSVPLKLLYFAAIPLISVSSLRKRPLQTRAWTVMNRLRQDFSTEQAMLNPCQKQSQSRDAGPKVSA